MNTAPLREVAAVNPRSERVAPEEPISFVGMAQLDDAEATARPLATRPYAAVAKGYTVFRDGDLLVAKITPCFENGKIGKAQLEHKIGVGSTEFHVVRPGERVHDKYLLHYLRQPYVRSAGTLRMTGSGGQRRVPASFLEQLEIPLPPIEEQRRIAQILDQADARRIMRRRVISHFGELMEATYREFFGQEPDSKAPLGTVAQKVVVGHVGPTSQHFRATGVPFLRTANVGRGEVVRQDLAHVSREFHESLRKSQLRGGDVLISRVVTDEVRAAILPDDLCGANCANIIVVRPSDAALSATVLGFLTLPSTQRGLLGRRVGSAQGVVNTTVLKELIFPIYTHAQQVHLADRIQAISDQLAAQHRSLAADEELFASLQARAFRGEL